MELLEAINIALIIAKKAEREGIQLKLVGLLGIAVIVYQKKGYFLIQERTVKDIDFILESREVMSKVLDLFIRENYEFDKEIFLYSEGKRCVFKHRKSNITIDVFVNPFEFSHRINFSNRFTLEKYTLSVTDLFLSKLQRVRIRSEDFLDIKSLLYSFDVTMNDERNISLERLNEVCSINWGLYYTVMKNLRKIEFDGDPYINSKNQFIQDSLIRSHKTFCWKFRSLFGDKFKYYEDVDKL